MSLLVKECLYFSRLQVCLTYVNGHVSVPIIWNKQDPQAIAISLKKRKKKRPVLKSFVSHWVDFKPVF